MRRRSFIQTLAAVAIAHPALTWTSRTILPKVVAEVPDSSEVFTVALWVHRNGDKADVTFETIGAPPGLKWTTATATLPVAANGMVKLKTPEGGEMHVAVVDNATLWMNFASVA